MVEKNVSKVLTSDCEAEKPSTLHVSTVDSYSSCLFAFKSFANILTFIGHT